MLSIIRENGDANFSPILLPSVQMAKCRYRFYCQRSLRVRCTILSTDLHRSAELLKSLWPMSYKKRLCHCHRDRVPSVMEKHGKPGKCKTHFPDLEKIMEFDKKTKIMEFSQAYIILIWFLRKIFAAITPLGELDMHPMEKSWNSIAEISWQPWRCYSPLFFWHDVSLHVVSLQFDPRGYHALFSPLYHVHFNASGAGVFLEIMNAQRI